MHESEKWKWSCVWLLATPWIAAHQAPPSMGFSRQEYWSGVPLPSLYFRFSSFLFCHSTAHILFPHSSLNKIPLSHLQMSYFGTNMCLINTSILWNFLDDILWGCFRLEDLQKLYLVVEALVFPSAKEKIPKFWGNLVFVVLPGYVYIALIPLET